MKVVENMLTVTVMVLVLAVWALVGFVVWVPLLTRAMFLFSADVLHSTLTAQPPSAVRLADCFDS